MATTSWNLDPPPGFQGLDPDKPVTFYFRHLPHWRQDGATYFVTFRLADALPQSKLRELRAIKKEFLANHGLGGTDWQSVLRGRRDQAKAAWQSVSSETWESFTHQQMQRVEKWLDQGMGDCHLKRRDVSQIVHEALHHFDLETYELGCFVIMPNHAHVIIRPLVPDSQPLEKILQSRKRRMARRINATLELSGSLWQDESFDRIIRDEEHLDRCVQYIGNNARRAGLPTNGILRWIRPEWEQLGWRFRNDNQKSEREVSDGLSHP